MIEDSGAPRPKIDGGELHPIEDLPIDCIRFLLANRYCEVDSMSQMAWDLFGKTRRRHGSVQAVMDWVHGHVEFGYQYASDEDGGGNLQGEARRLSGLSTLPSRCTRALNVPADMPTGYLGDIGVPPIRRRWISRRGSRCIWAGGGMRWMRDTMSRASAALMARRRITSDVALSTSFPGA